MINIEIDETEYPQFIEAFKARYFVETNEEALKKLKDEIIQLYAYGRQQLLINSLTNK